MRPHDPSLCDYYVVEERLVDGRSSVTVVMLPLVPQALADFGDEETTQPDGRTLIGPPIGIARRPAR